MPESRRDNLDLPLVRLDLAGPFLEAAIEAGVDVDALLAPLGVTREGFDDPDLFLPAPAMYDVVEALAEASPDPFIGVRLGYQLNPFGWAPLANAARVSHSVGELLLRFSLDAYREATSVEFRLETSGTRSTFSEHRLTDGGRQPRHNDGFGAAYVLSILRHSVAEAWNGTEVLATVCDPTVFPAGFLDIRLARGGSGGFSVVFPSRWLLLAPGLDSADFDRGAEVPVRRTNASSTAALEALLLSKLHDPGLDGERVARLCGVSKRTLSRRLAVQGTSIKKEIDRLRRQQAEAALLDRDKSVAQVGASVGYADANVFTRAFKRWTGMTPSQFRRRQQDR